MNRRNYLAGLGVAAGTVLAGCSANEANGGNGNGNGNGNGDADENDGPPQADLLPTGAERIEEIFRYQLEQELHHGAQLAVYHEGEQVVDLAGGTTGPDGGETTSESRHVLFSTTKPYTAGCVHRLVDRGDLAYDDYMVDHWSDFAAGDSGKEDVTIRHVLSHQSGLHAIPAIDDDYSVWGDPDEKERLVEQAELAYAPGSRTDYHLLSYGWLIDGLVRQVTGKQIDQFADEELFDPLGLDDTSIGIDGKKDVDVATLTGFEPYDQITEPDAPGYTAEVAALFNQDSIQRSVVGAANGIGTATDLARYQQCLLDDGEDLFSEEIVDEWTSPAVEQENDDGSYTRRGLGVSLTGGPGNSYGVTAPHNTFGHGGLGSIMTWADPGNDLAFAYVTNGIRDGHEHMERVSTLSDTVRHELS